MKTKPVRYQDCPWYVRFWRRRWYLMIPWWAFRNWRTFWVDEDGNLDKEELFNTWAFSWSIAVGTAQIKMEWYYTWDEVKEDLDSKD